VKNSTAPARTAPAQPPWSVIVFGHDMVVLDHPGAGNRVIPHVPAGLLTDVGLLLDECAQRFVHQGEGTVIVQHCPLPYSAEMLDGITHRVQLEELINKAAAAGWNCTPSALKHASGWATFYKAHHATVHLGILDGMDPDKSPLFPIDGDYTAGDIAAQLARYQELTGVSYRINPGVSGLAMIRQWYNGRPAPRGRTRPDVPSWRWHGNVPEIATPDDIVWERTPSKAEIAAGPFVHGYDLNLAHLAAASACSLGWQQPDATGAIPFDPARPGVWRIEMPPAQQWGKLFPPVINPGKVARDGTGWISTPGATFLRQLGHAIVVHDSWTSPEIPHAEGREGAAVYGRQILRPFAERLRDALAMHGRALGHPAPCNCPRCRLRATLKQTYTGAFGMMLTESSGIYRPDWVWNFHDLNRYNLTRKLLTLPNRPPIMVNKDAAYYLDEHRDPRHLGELLGYSTTGAFGKFKPDYSGAYLAWKAERTAARRRLQAQRGQDVKRT
jgi:hypothetical protein